MNEDIDIFGDEGDRPTYEGLRYGPRIEDQDPGPIELDATQSAYASLDPRLQKFVDAWVEDPDADLVSIVRGLGLSPSLTYALVRRVDVQDAFREALQVKYGTRIMGELEIQAHLSKLGRDTSLKPLEQIAALKELAQVQGLKDANVRQAKERMQNAIEVVVTREEGSAGTMTRAQVEAMEDDA